MIWWNSSDMVEQ